MKIHRLEAHDRLQHFKKEQSVNVFQGAEDCLKRNPLALAIQDECPYVYIFAHPRTADDGVTKRLLWQPRLSIPQAQSNSYLFRAVSKTDLVEVVWIIPQKEYWKMYSKGKLTQFDYVQQSIDMFINNRKELEKPHPEDWPEEKCRKILAKILINQKCKENKIITPEISEGFSVSSASE